MVGIVPSNRNYPQYDAEMAGRSYSRSRDGLSRSLPSILIEPFVGWIQ